MVFHEKQTSSAHTVQTTVQVPFLKITAVLWHGEVLHAYFPFHHTEYEKDVCLRVLLFHQ